MKALDPALKAHLAGGVTTLCWCWRIERRDGVVFGFTEHDLPLSFDGVSYEPESGMMPSEIRAGSDLSVDAQDAEGILSSDRISEADILDGLWDGASVEAWRVNWKDTSQRVLMRRGATGEIRRGRVGFVAEVRSISHLLGQTVGRTYQSACDAALGDSRCKVNLDSPAYRGEGVVTDTVREATFAASGLSSFDPGFFEFGMLEWSTGANAGRKVEVSQHSIAGGVAVLTLIDRPIKGIALGDEFVVRAGCDKRLATCAGRFSNVPNFRGFPHIPGQDAIVRYATRAGGHEGEVI